MIVTDLLTGKRVSRAHISRMDQILPPELSAFELECLRPPRVGQNPPGMVT
jgi:hypothetical protein